VKRSISKFVSLCAAIVFTVGLASGVAHACARGIHAADDGGNYFHCRLTGSDSQWCYYDCTCTGDCEDLYNQFGLEAY